MQQQHDQPPESQPAYTSVDEPQQQQQSSGEQHASGQGQDHEVPPAAIELLDGSLADFGQQAAPPAVQSPATTVDAHALVELLRQQAPGLLQPAPDQPSSSEQQQPPQQPQQYEVVEMPPQYHPPPPPPHEGGAISNPYGASDAAATSSGEQQHAPPSSGEAQPYAPPPEPDYNQAVAYEPPVAPPRFGARLRPPTHVAPSGEHAPPPAIEYGQAEPLPSSGDHSNSNELPPPPPPPPVSHCCRPPDLRSLIVVQPQSSAEQPTYVAGGDDVDANRLQPSVRYDMLLPR